MASSKVFVRSPYNYDVKAVSDETGLVCPEPTLAQQQFRDDSDPNTIMKQFARTRDPALLQGLNTPQYGDFTGIGDYQSALNSVIQAQDAFMELDAHVRARFANDPGLLLDFLSNGENRDEAIKLGLIPSDLPPGAVGAPQRAQNAPGDKSSPPADGKGSKKNKAPAAPPESSPHGDD